MSEAPTEQITEPAGAPSRRRRGLLGWLWRLALVLLLLVAAGLALLVGTEAGLRAALGLAQSAMPGRLSIQSVSGRLIGPLEIQGLRFGDAAAVVEVDRTAFDWRPRELLAGRVHLSVLELQGVRVTPGDAPRPRPSRRADRRGCPTSPCRSRSSSTGSGSATRGS